MNTRVSRDFEFLASIHHEDSFIVNSYDLTLSLDVTTENIDYQNIAMDRIKYLFNICLDSCVFVDINDSKAIDNYTRANMKVCPLPDEPYDQIIAAVLISKINAITENHLFLNEVSIISSICDDVCFYVRYDEEADFQNLKNVWWTENSPSINMIKKLKKEKVVQLHKDPKDWHSVGLGWEEPKLCKTDKGEIVFIPVDK
jgi:hypothetical protein